MVPVTFLVEKITEANELQNTLACPCAGIKNSFSLWQLPEFLIRNSHFLSEETILKKNETGEGKEELGEFCLGETAQEQNQQHPDELC